MAQNITLMGASYSAVPAVTLPKTGGGTASFTDVTDTTASAADVASGKYFYTAAGVRTQGTNSGGGGGVAVATAMASAAGGSDIIFENLLGEPTSFIIVCAEQTLATGASPYKTAAVMYDGTSDAVQYITNTNNAQMTYQKPSAVHFYNSGQLLVTSMDSQFVNGDYEMYYTYGGSASDIGTSLIQVGSGATSITFTDLPSEPLYWSCVFTSNIGTSSGYTRAHVVASDGNDIIGREMGTGSEYSNAHWAASYSNGNLTITSQSTSQGGYFHQPGYYQLTYAAAGAGEITTEPLTVTENGVYTAPSGTAYTPVTVNVSAGAGKNAQTAQSTSRSTSSTYTEVITLTCSKAGTYDVYWSTFRSSTSGTWGSQLYLNDSAYGSAETGSWSNHIQNIHLSNVTIAANAEVAVRVRTRGNSYYGYVGTLTIIEA